MGNTVPSPTYYVRDRFIFRFGEYSVSIGDFGDGEAYYIQMNSRKKITFHTKLVLIEETTPNQIIFATQEGRHPFVVTLTRVNDGNVLVTSSRPSARPLLILKNEIPESAYQNIGIDKVDACLSKIFRV